MSKLGRLLTRTFLLILLTTLVAACGSGDQASENKTQGLQLKSQALDLNPFTYTRKLNTTGELSASKNLVVKSKLNEDVDQFLVDEGGTVQEGQVIARMDTRLLTIRRNRSRYRMHRAEHELTIARRDYNRKQNLLKKDLISNREFDQSKLEYQRAQENYRISKSNYKDAELQLSYTNIESPFDGFVENHLVESGERVQPGQPIVRILKLNPLDLTFFVDPQERSLLEMGDSVTVRINQQDHQGSITHISRDVTKRNKLYEVEATVPNPNSTIPAGETVRIITPLERLEKVVEIPLDYVDREREVPRLVFRDPQTDEVHVRELEPIEYRKKTVLVRLAWPKDWKLIPGGVYSSATGLSQ